MIRGGRHLAAPHRRVVAAMSTRALVAIARSPHYSEPLTMKKETPGFCFFSTSSKKDGDDEPTSSDSGSVLGDFYTDNQNMIVRGGLGVGAAVMLYGVTRGVYHSTCLLCVPYAVRVSLASSSLWIFLTCLLACLPARLALLPRRTKCLVVS